MDAKPKRAAPISAIGFNPPSAAAAASTPASAPANPPSVAPAAGSRSYIGQNDTPSGSSTFASKQSGSVLAKDGGAIVWSTVTIA